MTKSDLRTGHVVTLRDGTKRMVYLNCAHNFVGFDENVLVDMENSIWNSLDYYNEDLTHGMWESKDIVKVELVDHPYEFAKPISKVEVFKTLWIRTEPKKMTVAEIEAILGYKVEIIAEK